MPEENKELEKPTAPKVGLGELLGCRHDWEYGTIKSYPYSIKEKTRKCYGCGKTQVWCITCLKFQKLPYWVNFLLFAEINRWFTYATPELISIPPGKSVTLEIGLGE